MIPDLESPEQEQKFFSRIQKATASKSHITYGIYYKDTLIGFINDVVMEGDSVELGYLISSKCWNLGFATEALKTLIEECFRVGFKRVLAAHFEENPASGKVMVKAGMKPIAKTEDLEYRGAIHHCLYYEITK